MHLQVSVPVEFQAAGVEPTQCPMPHPIAGAPHPQPDLPVGHSAVPSQGANSALSPRRPPGCGQDRG